MIKIGIIGLGHMGNYHASACKLIPNIKLTAIADPNQENWKKIKSSKIIKTKNYNDFLDHIDAAIIAVPTNFHYSIAKNCLLKGKHILVEKPLTKNIEQAIELFELAEKKKLTLHVGHLERFNGAVQELKKIIQDPYLIESHRLGPFVPRVQKDTVILDLMIHDLDIILNMINSKVKKLNVIGNKIKTNLTDIANVQIEFENSVIANLISSRASQSKQRTMSIHQKNSFIKLDFTTQDISIHRHTSASVKIGNKQLKYKQEGIIERLFVYKDNPLKLEIENFIHAINSGKKMTNSKSDITALKIALKLEQLVEENSYDLYNCGNRHSAASSMQKPT
ncbi:gfo/Idh/MocA family oxidoreductase [Candidatus Dependentiae bacterium]|nr:gfo/Idh/MocA family oxidoreductase [Candidatus Dependentiae bacterium]